MDPEIEAAMVEAARVRRTSIQVVRLQVEEYLDEMERRNATGFQRWLEADAQAADDPEAFLRTGSGRDGESAA